MSTAEQHQTLEFEDESHRFVSSHIADFPEAPGWILNSPTVRAKAIKSVLDVGCGPGTYLRSMVRELSVPQGVGVEPSAEAVDLLRQAYASQPTLAFKVGSAHDLPFETDQFDLVVCWSVLHWIGRNEYLQALGELVRVTRDLLVVRDFVPAQPYKVAYRHDPRFRTYKTDFVPLILGSGIMRAVGDLRWWDGNDPGTVHAFEEADLLPFLGNHLNYHARRGAIFRKDYDAMPLLSEADFAPPES